MKFNIKLISGSHFFVGSIALVRNKEVELDSDELTDLEKTMLLRYNTPPSYFEASHNLFEILVVEDLCGIPSNKTDKPYAILISEDGKIVSGMAEPTAEITIKIGDDIVATAVADSEGKFSTDFDPALTDGTVLSITAIKPPKTESDKVEKTVEVMTIVLPPKDLQWATDYEIKGKTEVATTVECTLPDNSKVLSNESTDGNFSITLAKAVKPGVFVSLLSKKTVGSQEIKSTVVQFEGQYLVPVPTDVIINTEGTNITGKVLDGQKVDIKVNSKAAVEVSTVNGVFNYTFSTSLVDQDKVQVRAKDTKNSVNSEYVSYTFTAVEIVKLTTPVDVKIEGLQLTGKLVDGDIAKIKILDQEYDATPKDSKEFTYDLPTNPVGTPVAVRAYDGINTDSDEIVVEYPFRLFDPTINQLDRNTLEGEAPYLEGKYQRVFLKLKDSGEVISQAPVSTDGLYHMLVVPDVVVEGTEVTLEVEDEDTQEVVVSVEYTWKGTVLASLVDFKIEDTEIRGKAPEGDKVILYVIPESSGVLGKETRVEVNIDLTTREFTHAINMARLEENAIVVGFAIDNNKNASETSVLEYKHVTLDDPTDLKVIVEEGKGYVTGKSVYNFITVVADTKEGPEVGYIIKGTESEDFKVELKEVGGSNTLVFEAGKKFYVQASDDKGEISRFVEVISTVAVKTLESPVNLLITADSKLRGKQIEGTKIVVKKDDIVIKTEAVALNSDFEIQLEEEAGDTEIFVYSEDEVGNKSVELSVLYPKKLKAPTDLTITRDGDKFSCKVLEGNVLVYSINEGEEVRVPISDLLPTISLQSKLRDGDIIHVHVLDTIFNNYSEKVSISFISPPNKPRDIEISGDGSTIYATVDTNCHLAVKVNGGESQYFAVDVGGNYSGGNFSSILENGDRLEIYVVKGDYITVSSDIEVIIFYFKPYRPSDILLSELGGSITFTLTNETEEPIIRVNSGEPLSFTKDGLKIKAKFEPYLIQGDKVQVSVKDTESGLESRITEINFKGVDITPTDLKIMKSMHRVVGKTPRRCNVQVTANDGKKTLGIVPNAEGDFYMLLSPTVLEGDYIFVTTTLTVGGESISSEPQKVESFILNRLLEQPKNLVISEDRYSISGDAEEGTVAMLNGSEQVEAEIVDKKFTARYLEPIELDFRISLYVLDEYENNSETLSFYPEPNPPVNPVHTLEGSIVIQVPPLYGDTNVMTILVNDEIQKIHTLGEETSLTIDLGISIKEEDEIKIFFTSNYGEDSVVSDSILSILDSNTA